MKKLISICMAMLISIAPMIAFAGDMAVSEETSLVGAIDISSAQISEIAYDDMIQDIVKKTGKSFDEVTLLIPDKTKDVVDRSNPFNLPRSRVYKYFTVSTQLPVSNYYKPTLYGYCYGWQDNDASVMPRGLIRIEYMDMNRSYNGTSKQFEGRIYGKLEDNWTLYYDVNGDFYDNGTTQVGLSTGAEMKEMAEVKFTIDYATNYYKYFQKASRITFK